MRTTHKETDMATTTLRARYENGVLTPLERVNLPEGAEITLRFDAADELSEEERTRRFLATAGAWKDAYDWDKFLEETYRERDNDTRPEVKL